MATLTLNITECPIYEICETNISGASITSSGYSKISAEELQLSDGLLGDYVIEWRLNAEDGELLFVSGNVSNTDPDISQTHPFVDEIVPGGTIYPIIRYVYIDGVRYDGYYSEGANYSPDLRLCLSATEVDSMDCDYSNTSTYMYTINYDFSNPNGSSSRTTIFNQSNDGSLVYFAFNFYARDVADMVKIYAVKESSTDIVTQLISVIAGDQQVTGGGEIDSGDSQYVEGERGYRVIEERYKHVVNLEGIICDYIKIEVISSIDYPSNLATVWSLSTKCLDEFDCDQYIVNTGWTAIDVDNITAEWLSGSCVYRFYIPNYEALTIPTDYRDYISYRPYSPWFVGATTQINAYVDLEYRLDGSSVGTSGIGCSSTSGVLFERDKTAQTLKLSFENLTDYNLIKNAYNTSMANPNISNWTLDNTDINYYKYIYMYQKFRVTDENCIEDNYTYRYMGFHPSATVTFNEVPGDYYITVSTPDLMTLGIPDDGCNTIRETGNSFVSSMNRLHNFDTFTDTSNIIDAGFMRGVYMVTGQTPSEQVAYSYIDFPKAAVDEVCPNYGTSEYSSNAYKNTYSYDFGLSYRFYRAGLKIVLTGVDKTDGNSLNSYNIYSIINPSTGQIDYSGASDVLIKSVTP